VAWSIADYLATLEKSAGELLHEDAAPDASSKPGPKIAAEPEPKPVAKPGPDREPKDGPEPAASAPEADH